jgi:broad specificity phosphatase PhoE
MKLIIVRHGETEENINKTIQGQYHGKLSPLGREQAQKIANRLKDAKIDFIYCSDLGRATETLVPIIKNHPHATVIIEPMLRERNFGQFNGKTLEEYVKKRNSVKDKNWRPLDGENFYDVKRRIRKFLKQLSKNHTEDDTILIITHGGWTGTFFSQIMNIPREKAFLIEFGNTSVSEIDFRKNGQHKLGVINCTKHLD